MIIFKDGVTGDELFSDACMPKISEDGAFYIFTASLKTEVKGDIDPSLLGANASQEEQQEEMESTSTRDFDFVLTHRLKKEENLEDSKLFKKYMKTYFKKLNEKMTAEADCDCVKEFQCQAQSFMKSMPEKLANASVYIGENCDILDNPGMPCIALWHDNGEEASVYVFKHGLCQEKY